MGPQNHNVGTEHNRQDEVANLHCRSEQQQKALPISWREAMVIFV